ncbi:MAG: hypothetical protein FWD06_10815 [Oscillospiraceae bacterium]|nr:hypothetical protein [Oscillospiraceae bacterium]
MTKQQACEKWVGEFNAIPQSMIQALHNADIDGWQELTQPRVGDEVYHYPSNEIGEIVEVFQDHAQSKYNEFAVRIGDEIMECGVDDIAVERYSSLPAWGTMWSFGDGCDDHWLTSEEGVQIMSDHDFRIYEHDDFGYFFGIDGAGYNFYEQHWLPLYEARGLQWHDKEIENVELKVENVGAIDASKLYDYIQENFAVDGTASRLIRNILDHVEAQEFSDSKLAQHHLHALLDGAFGLTVEEILQFGAGLEPETVGGYRIIDRVVVDDLVFKLGYNPDAAQPYVTWRCSQDAPKDNYWGHYWQDKSTAQTDLLMRSDAARTNTPYDHTLLNEPRASLKSALKAGAERSKAEFNGTTLPTPPGDAR